MGRKLTDREELQLWKTGWNELEGHLLRGLGCYKLAKARLERDRIHHPMPDDILQIRVLGAKASVIIHSLNMMKEIKTSLYHGRDLTPEQSRELQQAMEEAADDQPVS